MAFSLFKILEPFWLFNFHLFQPQASPNPVPQSRRTPTQPQPLSQGLFSPKPAAAQILGQVAARVQALGWLRLAPGGGVRLRSSSGRLQAGWGMRGWAGKKKVKKKSIGKAKKKSNKSQKKVKCADPSLGGLLEATKSQKKSRKKGQKWKKSKNSQKKSRKKKSNVKTKRGS